MAFATSFEESNNVISLREDAEIQGVEPLSVFQGPDITSGFPVTISCWKLSAEELEEVVRTKRIWVVVLGMTTFPIHVQGDKPKFTLMKPPSEEGT